MFPWLVLKASAAAYLFLNHLRPLVKSDNHNKCFLDDKTPKNTKLCSLDFTSIRGGSDDLPELIPENQNSPENAKILNDSGKKFGGKHTTYARDFIEDFIFEPDISDESRTLREMINSRTNDYLEELNQFKQTGNDPPDPKRLLHYLAPRIPAIKHSPDFMLRIHAARADLDAGVAACLIGTMGRVAEIYDKITLEKRNSDSCSGEALPSVGAEIVSDRRFEQLVECVLCGMNIKRQKRESKVFSKDSTNNESPSNVNEENEDSNILDIANTAGVRAGISIRDACRAAWGIASLGGGQLETMGGEKINDILISLSLRAAELLLARVKNIRDGDMTAEEFNKEAEEIVHNVASAMLVFGKVKAQTGLKSEHLFNVCCSILSQSQEISLWERKEEDLLNKIADSNFEFDEVVERLAAAEGDIDIEGSLLVEKLARSEKELELSSILDSDSQASIAANVPPIIVQQDTQTSSDLLLDSLSPNEVADIMFSIALHSNTGISDIKEELSLSETTAALREVAFDRLLEWLCRDLELAKRVVVGNQCEENKTALNDVTGPLFDSEEKKKIPNEHLAEDALELPSEGNVIEDFAQNENIIMPTSQIQKSLEVKEVQVVDAATLLAMSNNTADGQCLEDKIDAIIATANPTVEESKEDSNSPSSIDGSSPEVEEVQVVDAATLLAMSNDAANGEQLELETETIITSKISTDGSSPEVEKMRVIDAATPLAMPDVAADSESLEVETEPINTSKGFPDDCLHEVEEVQVVDSPVFLSSSNDPTDSKSLEVETGTTITSKGSAECSSAEVQEVQVVEAATLLAMSDDASDSEPLELESEMIQASKGSTGHDPEENSDLNQKDVAIDTLMTDTLPPLDKISSDELTCEQMIPANNLEVHQERNPYFSLPELCTIAWSVSQLKDPLQFEVIDTITNIIAVSERTEVTGLLGIEKLNLISAMAQCILERRPLGQSGDFESNPALFVTKLVAENALVELALAQGDIGENELASKVNDVLMIYQPHELSSLVWSLACIILNNINVSKKDGREFGAVSTLANLALLTAKSNVALFSSEDLAKIAWSFLVLSDNRKIGSRTLVYKSLGHSLTAIETSLLRWESGHFTNYTSEGKRPNRRNRFITFFQRRLMHADEHRIGDFHDDDDDTHLSSPSESGKLPLLRDLPVDPSTLCRLASSCFHAAEDLHVVEGSWTLVRIAVRLLTSKHGYLLKETKIQDIIGLCNACATNKEIGKGRDYISRTLARRLVQLLNEALQETKAESASGLLMLSEATPGELCSLFWSLGEIGVRHSSTDDNPLSAFKKLRLVTKRPLLSRDELESLSPTSFALLLNAIVSLGTTSTDPSFVQNVLRHFKSKVNELASGPEFCQVVESLSLIRRLVGHLSKKRKKSQVDQDNPDVLQDIQLNSEGCQDTAEVKKNSTTKEEIHGLCSRLLSLTADVAMPKVSSFTAKEMRTLLSTYSVLPLPADTLVDAMDQELAKRIRALERAGQMEDSASIENLVRKAADDAVEAANAFASLSEGAAPPTTARDDDEHSVVAREIEGLSELLDRAAAATSAAAARLERVVRGTRVTTDACLRRLEEGEAIELGRCQELVSDYRRIEFSK